MTYDQTTRPSFYESQYLGSADLNAIVDYGHTQAARHMLGAHTWGIATGLQLVEQSTGSSNGQVNMFIEPGYAWDGFGRSIVVLTPLQISETLFQGFVQQSTGPTAIQVWLQYQETAGGAPPPGFSQCDTTSYGGVIEGYQIVAGNPAAVQDNISFAGYSVSAEAVATALDPTSKDVLYDGSVPDQTFPDPIGTGTWLIPLGYVLWQSATAAGPGMFVTRLGANQNLAPADSTVRVDAGVIAGALLATESQIEIRARTQAPSTIPSDDLVWIDGSLRVAGDIRPFGGALRFLNAFGSGDIGAVAPECSPAAPKASAVPPLMIQREDCNGKSYLEIIVGQGTGTYTGASSLQIGPINTSSGKLDPGVTVLDAGFVGIGTTTPAVPLSFPDSDGDKIALWQPAAGASFIGIGVGKSLLQIFTDTASSDIAFGSGGNSKAFSENVRITGTGFVGINNSAPKFPLSFPNVLGDKIALWGQTVSSHYGFGIQGSLLQIYSDVTSSDIAFGTGSSTNFSEVMRIKGNGLVGINNSAPPFPLSFPDQLGDKIGLWGQNPTKHYGLGIQSNTLQIYTDTPSGIISFGSGGSTSFQESMHVSGDGTLAVVGDVLLAHGLYAPGSPDSLRMIRGTINSNGSIQTGGGFTINRWATGHFIINFNVPFADTPSGSVTQIFFNGPGGGNTLDNAVIISIDKASVSLQTGDSSGTASDRSFTFLFVGAR